jgi:hypothetical protein
MNRIDREKMRFAEHLVWSKNSSVLRYQLKILKIQLLYFASGYPGSAFPVSCVTFSIPITTQVVSVL